MKLLRYGEAGAEKPGILDEDGQIRDLSGVIDDLNGAQLGDDALQELRRLNTGSLPLVEDGTRIGPCVGGVGKFVCVGLNYYDHAQEAGMAVPPEPIVFFKATSAICGPNDGIEIPRGSFKTDWEVELGVVIGKPAKYVSEERALDYVAGYCVVNDVSERDFQLNRGGQWVKGKSADTFGPIGPWLVTRDEVPNPQSLELYLDVNGHRYQSGNTGTMVFSVARIISHISQFMSLQPGDVISTGTPPGVGMGQSPEIYLRTGDRVELGVQGLGKQQSVAYSADDA